jgi:uncharacterized repeat protein (TIGR01451 family)
MPFHSLLGSPLARSANTSLAIAFVALFCLTADAGAATFTVDRVVTDASDTNVGDGACIAFSGGGCTLRAAVQEANFLPVADTIILPSGQTAMLTLGPAGTAGTSTGDLDVLNDLTVQASGSTPAAIDGGDVDRIFDVKDATPLPSIKLTLTSITLRNGKVTGEDGGAIRTQGTLVATDVRVTSGDAVHKTVPPTADALGGGIAGGLSSVITLTRSRLDANSATSGGALSVAGTTTIDRTTMDGNSSRAGESGSGGAIENRGALSVVNSTIANNTDGGGNGGGALINGTSGGGGVGQITIAFSTISGNTSGLGSAVRNLGGAGSFIKIASSIVLGDCNAVAPTSDVPHHNIGGGVSCGLNHVTDAPNGNPTLGALTDNGGATPTRALAPGAGVDGVNDVPAASCVPVLDQRGGRRPIDGACDVGAYEVGSLADLVLTGSVAPANAVVGGDITYTYDLSAGGPDLATGIVFSDPLPASVSFVSASASNGTCGGPASGSGGTVTCGLDPMGSGSSRIVTVVVRSGAADGALVNAATVAAEQNDLTPGNNTVALTTSVAAAPCGSPGAEVCPVVVCPDPAASGCSPPALSLTAFRARPSKFRTTGGNASTRGTKLEFTLSRAAKVNFTVRGPITKRRVCKGSGRSRKCSTVTRSPVAGTFAVNGKAGSNASRFAGRLRRRALKPGSYRISAQAVSGTERSRVLTIAVGVVK